MCFYRIPHSYDSSICISCSCWCPTPGNFQPDILPVFHFCCCCCYCICRRKHVVLEIKEHTTYERSIQTYGILSMLKYIMIDMNMINHHKLIMWKTGEMLVGLAKAFFMDLWSHSCSHHWRPMSFLMTLLHSLRDILCSIVCQTYKHMLTWTLVCNMSLREYVSFKAWCASIALHTAADFLQISVNNCMVRT